MEVSAWAPRHAAPVHAPRAVRRSAPANLPKLSAGAGAFLAVHAATRVSRSRRRVIARVASVDEPKVEETDSKRGRGIVVPMTRVEGLEEVKLALKLACIDPSLGGVGISGGHGTGKTTLARSLRGVLPKIEVVDGSICNCDPSKPAEWDVLSKERMKKDDKGEAVAKVIDCPFIELPSSPAPAAQAPAPHAVSQTHVHVPMWGGGSPTLPYRPVSNPAAGVLYTLHQAFCSAPSAPSARQLRVAMRGGWTEGQGGESVPTGLVWPSPEAEEKLREALVFGRVDGIKLYPTHAWKDDMEPILDSKKKLEDTPVIVGVAADSGCGKSTFLRRILGALGTEVEPGHTAIGDMMTVICLDDYHTNDRAGRKATGLTALDARENDFDLMGVQIEALKKGASTSQIASDVSDGKAVYKPIYNHDTGNKDPPELIEPNKVMVFEGLHPIYDEKARTQLDLAIYIDIVNDVKFAWKVQRDVEERGWTEEQVREDIEKRLPDFSKYVDPQKANADVVLRYEPSDQGLPYLKVKLIQKKGGNFPMVTLKKDLELKGSKQRPQRDEPGATLKMYDDDWRGSNRQSRESRVPPFWLLQSTEPSAHQLDQFPEMSGSSATR
ncbi:unnamed protein product [Effrenium voratum]|nr:unnamed protein product [Effrenium voratum]